MIPQKKSGRLTPTSAALLLNGVLPSVAMDGGPDAERHRAGEGDRHRHDDDQRARLDLLDEKLARSGLEDQRMSPVADQHAADPSPVLHDERIVEAERLAQAGKRDRDCSAFP